MHLCPQIEKKEQTSGTVVVLGPVVVLGETVVVSRRSVVVDGSDAVALDGG